jgi:peptide/nickel transport system substrate-binding protein
VATTSSPYTLDPTQFPVATREISIHVFETLVAFDKNFQIVPELASSWEISDDGLTYTFYLRRDVRFHNGDEMAAEDVKASIERFHLVGQRKTSLDVVESVEIVDDYTIRISLKEPEGAFLATLASPLGQLAIMPKEVVEGAPRERVEPVGTGPYYVAEWIPDRHTILRRFEDYQPYGDKPSGLSGLKAAYLDEIIFLPVPNASTRVIGLQAGDYDFADLVPQPRVSYLETYPGIEVVQIGPSAIFNAWINHGSTLGHDLTLRRAIQIGLDMEELMLAASDGAGILNPGIHHRNQVWHSNAGEHLYNVVDVDEAKRLIAESSYNGEELVILGAVDYDYMYKGAINLADQLERLGLKVRLVTQDFASLMALAREDRDGWDLLMMSHSTRFDPSDNVDAYFSPTQVFNIEVDEELAGWIKSARRSSDMAERISYYDKIQARMYEEVLLWYKFYDLISFQAYGEKVQGYTPFVIMNFNNVWLQK